MAWISVLSESYLQAYGLEAFRSVPIGRKVGDGKQIVPEWIHDKVRKGLPINQIVQWKSFSK